MMKEINLSKFFPIRAEIIDDRIAIVLRRVIAGEVSLVQLLSLLGKELAIKKSDIDITVRGSELIITLRAVLDSQIDEMKVVNIAGDLISRLLPPTLRSKVTGKKLVYITRASGIPLIGRIDFGIIDRGTNLIQVRPSTGCILDCPFCSVDSGMSSRTRITDFIVDPDYIVDEARKLCEFKGSKSIELHIDGQGEPTLYPYLAQLVGKLSEISGVDTISLQTNGIPLTENLVDDLATAGLARINLSINSLDRGKAIMMSGISGYELKHVLDIAEYARDSKIAVLFAPLWVPGLNDDDICDLIQFVKKFGMQSEWPVLGIQNYLIHRHGRKMRNFQSCSMNHFRYELDKLAKTFDIPNLILSRGDFGITKMDTYPRPFRIGEKAEIEIVEQGRLVGEMVGVARGRALHVLTSEKRIGVRKLVQITRTKHNIFIGRDVEKQGASVLEDRD